MKKILSLDGGGAKGIIQSSFLAELEAKRKGTVDFDLIVGTSVGSIVGGLLAYGLDAMTINTEMKKALPKIFKGKLFSIFRRCKYDRENVRKAILNIIGEDIQLKNLKTKFVATSIDASTCKTHFFKSWEKKDGELWLIDVMLRSSSAPYYFGYYTSGFKMWEDGGVGIYNNPALYSLIEANKLNWDIVELSSIGTGYTNLDRPEKTLKKYRGLRQGIAYMKDGGFAHRTAEDSMNNLTRALSDITKTQVIYNRFNNKIGKKQNIMDGIKYLDYYEKIGIEMANKI